MKNVLIISSTPRKGGNSELLAEEFARGARETGNNVEIVYLRDKKIGFCKGCLACEETGRCAQKDDMPKLIEKVLDADVIVLATPVYFYTMCAQMKVFLDRLVPVYKQVRSDIYLFCAAGDDDTSNLRLAIDSMRGCTRDCLEGCTEMGVITAGGVYEVGAVAGSSEIRDAYAMGLGC